MAEANWYWADGDQRNGPVTPAAIARLVADGKLGADDLIWKEGMADWITVSKVPALVKHLKQPNTTSRSTSAAPGIAADETAAVVHDTQPLAVASESDINALASESPKEVGYYNPSAGMPPRAAATLAKHAHPRGDIGEWPLDDAQVAQFDEALGLRKKIDGAASLFRLLFLLAVIADVFVVIGAVVGLASARSGRMGTAGLGIGVAAVIFVGISILYYFAWKGTVRSQRWAPLTMGILFLLGGLANLAQFALVGAAAGTGPALIVGLIAVLIAAAFAYVAFKGFLAIPKYLLQPAWCQELLSKTSGK